MKLTFRRIFLSLFLGVAFSFVASLPVINNVEARQAQQEKLVTAYQTLNKALINPNFETLQSLLAEDFELVTLQKDTLSKQEWIRNIQKGGVKYDSISPSKVKPKGYDELSVTARIFGEMWNHKGSWNLKLDIDTRQNGDKVQITKIIVKPVNAS